MGALLQTGSDWIRVALWSAGILARRLASLATRARSGHPELPDRKPPHSKAALQTGETTGTCKEDAGRDACGRGMDSTPAESMSLEGPLPPGA